MERLKYSLNYKQNVNQPLCSLGTAKLDLIKEYTISFFILPSLSHPPSLPFSLSLPPSLSLSPSLPFSLSLPLSLSLSLSLSPSLSPFLSLSLPLSKTSGQTLYAFGQSLPDDESVPAASDGASSFEYEVSLIDCSDRKNVRQSSSLYSIENTFCSEGF